MAALAGPQPGLLNLGRYYLGAPLQKLGNTVTQPFVNAIRYGFNQLPTFSFTAKKLAQNQQELTRTTDHLRLSGELSDTARTFFDTFVTKAGPNGRAICEKLKTHWEIGGKTDKGERVSAVMHELNKLGTTNWPKFLSEKTRIQRIFQSFIDGPLQGADHFNLMQTDAVATRLLNQILSSPTAAVKTTSLFTKITAGTASALSAAAGAIKYVATSLVYRHPFMSTLTGAALFTYSPSIGKYTISAIPSTAGYVIDEAANGISVGLNAVNLPKVAEIFTNTTVQKQFLSGYDSLANSTGRYVCSFSIPYYAFTSCRLEDESVLPIVTQATDQGLKYGEELGKALIKGAISYGSERINEGMGFIKENVQQKWNETTSTFTQTQETIANATIGAEEALKEKFHNSTLLQAAAAVTAIAIVVLVGREIWKTFTPAPVVAKNDDAKKG